MERTNSCIEQGEKFEYNPNTFQKKLTKKLIERFPNLDEEYIKAFVQKIIDTDAGFISEKTTKEYQYLCEICGICCEGCPELRYGRCGIYNRRPRICEIAPYWEVPDEAHGMHFWTGCPYAFNVVYYEALKILKNR